MVNDYLVKLKDPRWQKKRLEILKRDKWTCQSCGDKTSTLTVHHMIYDKQEPWDMFDEFLITLCEECHQKELYERSYYENKLIDTLKYCLLSDDIQYLDGAFDCIKFTTSRKELISVISHTLTNERLQKILIKHHKRACKNGKT